MRLIRSAKECFTHDALKFVQNVMKIYSCSITFTAKRMYTIRAKGIINFIYQYLKR